MRLKGFTLEYYPEEVTPFSIGISGELTLVDLIHIFPALGSKAGLSLRSIHAIRVILMHDLGVDEKVEE